MPDRRGTHKKQLGLDRPSEECTQQGLRRGCPVIKREHDKGLPAPAPGGVHSLRIRIRPRSQAGSAHEIAEFMAYDKVAVRRYH